MKQEYLARNHSSLECTVLKCRPQNLLSFYCVSLLAVWCFSTYAYAIETWIDATGNYQLQAEFVELKDGLVHLRTTDQEIKRIPLEKLNAASQQRVQQLLKEQKPTSESTSKESPVDLDSLNEHARGEITPNENVVVALWKSYGFEKLDPSIREPYIRALGLPSSVNSDHSFITWQEFCIRQGPALRFQENPSPQHTTNRAAVEQWLEANSSVLDAVSKATENNSYYSPMVNAPGQTATFTAAIPILSPARDLTQALIASANSSLQKGNLDNAWKHFLASYKVARLVGNELSSMGLLVGNALEQTVSIAIVELTTHPSFTREFAENCLADLNSLPPASTMSKKVAPFEKAILLDVANQIAQKGPVELTYITMSWLEIQGHTPPIKSSEIENRGLSRSWNNDAETVWRQTPAFISAIFDPMVVALKTADPKQRLELVAQQQQEISELHRASRMFAIFDSNRSEQDLRNAGQIMSQGTLPAEVDAEDIVAYLSTMWFPDVKSMVESEIGTHVRSGTIPVTMALGAYRAERRKLPASLQELVPTYLPQIPVDVVYKTPLVYRQSDRGYILYSLGPDGVDDGGNEDRSARTYDLAFIEVNFGE